MANNTPELNLQIALINWIRYQYPRILFCASAGGLRTSMKQASKMKASGYVKGFPDLFIYEPSRGFNGLAIELKAKGGRTSPAQKVWIQKLTNRGYYATVCTGIDESMATIKAYFNESRPIP